MSSNACTRPDSRALGFKRHIGIYGAAVISNGNTLLRSAGSAIRATCTSTVRARTPSAGLGISAWSSGYGGVNMI